MASSTDMRFSPRHGSAGPAEMRALRAAPRGGVVIGSATDAPPAPLGSQAGLVGAAVGDFKERRRRRRVAVESMYTWITLRILGVRGPALEGHVLDLSENGMAVQVDEQIAIGQAVAVEFSIPGLGTLRNEGWPAFAVAAQVVRIDDLDDFPRGPYRTALRFVRISTMVQAQIARFVAMPPARVS